ncbi:MAG TPA: hypothetical protein VIK21_09040 [Desulfuromonadaceae bacterium]
MMPIVYKKNSAVFSEIAGVEEAETLLEWLHKHPKGKIDLAACTHLHPANLQVMMAAKRSNYVRPSDDSLADWVDSALKTA